MARRLVGRFTAQGLIHHDLSKASLTAAPDAIPRVILLGRLALYGPRAARLHEEIVPVTARWIDPARGGKDSSRPMVERAADDTLASLQAALGEAERSAIPSQVQTRLAASAQGDIHDLLPHLESRVDELAKRAEPAPSSPHRTSQPGREGGIGRCSC